MQDNEVDYIVANARAGVARATARHQPATAKAKGHGLAGHAINDVPKEGQDKYMTDPDLCTAYQVSDTDMRKLVTDPDCPPIVFVSGYGPIPHRSHRAFGAFLDNKFDWTNKRNGTVAPPEPPSPPEVTYEDEAAIAADKPGTYADRRAHLRYEAAKAFLEFDKSNVDLSEATRKVIDLLRSGNRMVFHALNSCTYRNSLVELKGAIDEALAVLVRAPEIESIKKLKIAIARNFGNSAQLVQEVDLRQEIPGFLSTITLLGKRRWF